MSTSIKFMDGEDKRIAGDTVNIVHDGVLTIQRDGWEWNYPLLNVREWSNW